MGDVEVFESLIGEAWLQGINPVAAQRRRDIDERWMRPMVIFESSFAVRLAASYGVPIVEALAVGLGGALASVGFCKMLLVRRA